METQTILQTPEEEIPSSFKLRHTLRGHEREINRIAWSPDGKIIASPSRDRTIRLWDYETGTTKQILRGHDRSVVCVAWSPTGDKLASGSGDKTVRLWDPDGTPQGVLEGHTQHITSLAWLPSSGESILASGSADSSIGIWNVNDPHVPPKPKMLQGHKSYVNGLVWLSNGEMLASASADRTIRIWSVDNKKQQIHQIRMLEGHSGFITCLSQSLDGKTLISCSADRTIRFWDINSGKLLDIIEAHTGIVTGVCISHDGSLLASKSRDHTVRIFRVDKREPLAVLREPASDYYPIPAFHPKLPVLATLGEKDSVVRIWDLDYDVLWGAAPAGESVHYTTAKLILVGDSGVGKTCLGWRLAKGEFMLHPSTHGQQFWVLNALRKTRDDGTECEAVLWDLAGQPDYRLVHSLFLDDVDTALVLFDPTNRQDPLSGVDFWLNQLRNKKKVLNNSILVGARTDCGTATLTDDYLRSYCDRNGICGGYIGTSAQTGEGLHALLDRLKAQVPWDTMAATVTTSTFKRIKEYILDLKEQVEHKKVLVNPEELQTQLQTIDPSWPFSYVEMMAAVENLANLGYVTVLRGSQRALSILLAPELLTNLASSIVLEARRHPHGLGVLEENRLLEGRYLFPELNGLDKDEREILLDAVAVLFLEHNLCFRQTFNLQTFLVFPSLINEKRPKAEDISIVEGGSYRVKGEVENLYASLVVLLGYTNTFVRTHQWQNQAQYEMGENEICGFHQTNYGDGEIELFLYYAEDTPEPVRLTFRGLFERFLSRRELRISRYQTVLCTKCGRQLARNVVMSHLARKENFSFCNGCGEKLCLPSPEPLGRLSRQEEAMLDVQQTVAERRTSFEAALARVKAIRRDRGEKKIPKCFISYAWGVPEHEQWVLRLAKDLRNAGIDVLLDRWHSLPGSNLDLFIERILSTDFVLPIGTPGLRQKYDTRKTDPVVAAELKLINLRVRQTTEYGDTVLPVLLAGDVRSSLSPQLQPLVCVDFREDDFYFRKLFDMIWRLYDLSFDHPLLDELQRLMTPRRE